MRALRLLGIIIIPLLLNACAPKKPKVDPVTEEMKKAVVGSAARVKASGVDWEVDPGTGEYWINALLKNQGGAGKVAVRGAIKVQLPYVGIGEGASKPQYYDMAPGQELALRIEGKVPADRADKAIGYVLEIYPEAGPTQ